MTQTQAKSVDPEDEVSTYAGAMTSKDDSAAAEEEDNAASETTEDAATAAPGTATDGVSEQAVVEDSDADREDKSNAKGKPEASRKISVSLSLRTAAVAGLIALLVAATGVMTFLYLGERNKVETQQRRAANDKHAEQIALDYAVGAATMNFQDLNAWKDKLVQGTSPALKEKLTKAATQMQQLVVPLQWSSTSQPLVAKVRSDTNGVYVVDTFVSVLTKTVQAPDNLQSTATYSITINSNDNWQITDVGGIGAFAGSK